MGTSRLRATLIGANHDPVAGKGWAYSVHVTDPSGRGLSGSVKIEFTFEGQVVGTDTPPVHPIRNGLWHDTLTFPGAAAGHPLALVAVVKTPAGSATLSWPVSVRP